MIDRLGDLRSKEIINVLDGNRMGFAGDIALDLKQARITHLILCGRNRCFGLLGREPDLFIPWEQVETIGEETILVRYDAPVTDHIKGGRLRQIFREK